MGGEQQWQRGSAVRQENRVFASLGVQEAVTGKLRRFTGGFLSVETAIEKSGTAAVFLRRVQYLIGAPVCYLCMGIESRSKMFDLTIHTQDRGGRGPALFTTDGEIQIIDVISFSSASE